MGYNGSCAHEWCEPIAGLAPYDTCTGPDRSGDIVSFIFRRGEDRNEQAEQVRARKVQVAELVLLRLLVPVLTTSEDERHNIP